MRLNKQHPNVVFGGERMQMPRKKSIIGVHESQVGSYKVPEMRCWSSYRPVYTSADKWRVLISKVFLYISPPRPHHLSPSTVFRETSLPYTHRGVGYISNKYVSLHSPRGSW